MSKKVQVETDLEVGFVEENVDVDGVQVSSRLSTDGRFEFPDPVPLRAPVEFQDRTSDLVRRLVFGELKKLAEDNDFESIDEADDFDIEDDPLDPLTPYEKYFEPKPSPVPAVDQNSSGAKVAGEGGPQPTGAAPTPVVKEGNSTST